LLPLNKRSRAWVKNLPIIVNDLNNSVSRLIGMRNMCLQNRPSPRNGPMGYDKIRLTHNGSVRYLLDAGELEGSRRRATDAIGLRKSTISKNR